MTRGADILGGVGYIQGMRGWIAALLVSLALVGCNPTWEGFESYDRGALERAQAAGKTVLLQVHDNACALCRGQAFALQQVLEAPEFKDVVRFQLDFEDDPELLESLGVTKISTVVLYRGSELQIVDHGTSNQKQLRKFILEAMYGKWPPT